MIVHGCVIGWRLPSSARDVALSILPRPVAESTVWVQFSVLSPNLCTMGLGHVGLGSGVQDYANHYYYEVVTGCMVMKALLMASSTVIGGWLFPDPTMSTPLTAWKASLRFAYWPFEHPRRLPCSPLRPLAFAPRPHPRRLEKKAQPRHPFAFRRRHRNTRCHPWKFAITK